MRLHALFLASSLALAACGGPSPTVEPPRSTSNATTAAAQRAERANTSVAPLLADETTRLGGGILEARLPRGEVEASDADAATPGILLPSEHVVRRPGGDLRIVVEDTGERAGDDFATRVIDAERARRCAARGAALPAEPDYAAPDGFTVVAFRPDEACSVDDPPHTRLWVRAPGGRVVTVELACAEATCRADGRELVEAFVASFTPGTPAAAPAGARALGPTESTALSASVPEGFLVSRHDGEDYVVYRVFRERPMGAPWEGITVSFLFSSSPNSLEEDYASRDARTRRVPGTIAGQRTRLLELVREGRTRLLGRMDLEGVQLDVEMAGSNSASLSELRAIVAGMVPPDVPE